MPSEDMDTHGEDDHLKTEPSPLYLVGLRPCPNIQSLYSLFPESEFLLKKLLGSNAERLTWAFQTPLSPKLNFYYISLRCVNFSKCTRQRSPLPRNLLSKFSFSIAFIDKLLYANIARRVGSNSVDGLCLQEANILAGEKRVKYTF